ncbi:MULTISPECIES: protein TolR [Candidatus Accumulibacter]|uniref:Biopolymer transport protein ExbD n=3 Tax=Candidatus Accumulibacter TaxID=327159 RepID=A0A080M636_9PROT|nr:MULTISPECIES: protein TolR [Candidatus Accumulibacter]HNL90680.1 protein TolR [Nitrospira sp.]KFB76757.1 MAG: Biopolymer transport protein ExbD [Candidatus Accumulibacter cognatus]MCM8623621.1 protein TolR [Accumulibacter sp.]QLH49038.1 MAG: protein TolR [Candidatus Accumulibacter cognatus]TMQ76379.1 Tol biopolymer transport system, TolR protein [Candidatus Accumulibacter phosphatis]
MRPRRLKNEINVVPYIDVMLVLLVIFMVTAPMMTTGTIDVPSVGKAAQTPGEALRVDVATDGKLTLVLPGRTEGRRVNLGNLGEAVVAAQKTPEQAVLVAGDKKVNYQAVMDVMAALQKAQVKRIGLLVEQSGR